METCAAASKSVIVPPSINLVVTWWAMAPGEGDGGGVGGGEGGSGEGGGGEGGGEGGGGGGEGH